MCGTFPMHRLPLPLANGATPSKEALPRFAGAFSWTAEYRKVPMVRYEMRQHNSRARLQ